MSLFRCAVCQILIEPPLAEEACPMCGSIDFDQVGDEKSDALRDYVVAVSADGPNDRVIFLTRDRLPEGLTEAMSALASRYGGVVLVGVGPDGAMEGDAEDWFEGIPVDEVERTASQFGALRVGDAVVVWVFVKRRDPFSGLGSWDVTDDVDVRRAIRTSRTRPPGRAWNDATRRRIYRASLAQFEELLTAAERATPASRPLLLYYSLAQAGNAVIAARGESLAQEPLHGLTWARSGPLLTRQIRPQKKGAFPRVARAIGATPPTRTVTLAEVWRCLPEFSKYPIHPGNPAAIPVWRWSQGKYPGWSKIPDPRVGGVLGVGAVASYGDLVDLLRSYPSASEWEPGAIGDSVQYAPCPDGIGTVVYWRTGGMSPVDQARRFDEVAPPYRGLGNWLLPDVGGTGDPVDPFIAWWMLMYALSMLCRYEPGVWVAHLDVDRTEVATALEGTVDEAIAAIPDIVFDALGRA